MTTYIYVYLDGKPLGFHDNWGKDEGKTKEFASFGGKDIFRCKAWEDAGADTEDETDWTKKKVLSIVLDTLRKMKFAEKDLARGQWMVGDCPLAVDLDPREEHGEHFFPVFEGMSEEDISDKVRAWVNDLLSLWEKGEPLSTYGKRMAERFPVTYRVFMARN